MERKREMPRRRTENQVLAGAPDTPPGVVHLNGVPRVRKSMKTKGSRTPKRGDLAAAKHLADWSGFDGYRGCRIYLFDRTLSRRTCEQLGLRYPALEPGVYCPSDALPVDRFHAKKWIAATAIDVDGRQREQRQVVSDMTKAAEPDERSGE